MDRKWQWMIVVVWLAALLIAPAAARAQDDVSWLLGQINGLRASVGTHGYALNAQLSAAAAQHSEYMATTCHVSHTQISGSTPLDRARANGYTGSWISENIYGGGLARASDAWNFWINSGIHYQGLVNPNTNEIGIGVASGGCGRYFTLVFGYRRDVTAPPAPVVQSGAGESGPPAPPLAPPPAPYVPPPPTRTPTPDIPTLTPSPTWTITPTHTLPPTGTFAPLTATPLVLPTVAAPDQAGQAVALAASSMPEVPPSPTPAPLRAVAVPDDPDDGFTPRDLIPFAVIGQIVLIGVAGFAYFRRSR